LERNAVADVSVLEQLIASDVSASGLLEGAKALLEALM
jgi:hypothetical protein